MDVTVHIQAAVGHDHVEKLTAHASVTDTKTGFGGKFGVQKDRVDQVQMLYLSPSTCHQQLYSFVLYTPCNLLTRGMGGVYSQEF